MLGTQFGSGISPFGAHATGSYASGNFVPPAILQSLQVAAQQLQQLQQLNFVQHQQLQQLQQWIQVVLQQSQQPIGLPGIPLQALSSAPQLFTTQPGHVM